MPDTAPLPANCISPSALPLVQHPAFLFVHPLVTVMALTFMDEGGITFRSLPVDGSMTATEPGFAMMILLPSASVTTSYVESKPEACLGYIDTNDAVRVSKTANNVIWNLLVADMIISSSKFRQSSNYISKKTSRSNGCGRHLGSVSQYICRGMLSCSVTLSAG